MGIQHTRNWRTILCVLALAACTSVGQFSHKKPWPTYSLQNMPQTRFTCHDKILGGYYADPETQCQMFHVCVKVAGVGVQDFRFLCPNGTAFDQEAQICADWGDVDCEQAVLYYGSDNFDLYRIGSGFESKRAPLAEEEEATFHLQRAETGDIRKSKETRVDQKVRPETFSYTKKYESTTRNQFYEGNFDNKKSNYDQNNDFSKATQRFEAPKKTTSSYYTTPRNNDFQSHADSRQDTEDLFKGSHSSNFFSNRKGGREDEFYDNKPATSTTTTTPKPYLPQNQFFNGNGPQSDFSEFNKIPEATTKRPHRGRRPISSLNNPNNLISTPTSRPSTSSTTYPTTVQDFPKSTKRITLQASYTPSFNYGNDPFYKSSSSSSTSSTTSTTTQRSSSPAQKFSFSANDYQQNIQPTTYSPISAFRYKTTTSKYEEINETALRGEKPGQSTLFNSQYENQNFEVFNRVSNRKSSNTERNIQKQQAKNTTLANRNEFTDYTKNKIPSGFQVPSNTQQLPAPQSPINLRLNVQPLDPSKLNSELRNINHTQQPHRGRVPIGRPNDRQQTEPQYFRTRPQETPAPFAVPHTQQQLAEKEFDSEFSGTPHREFSRIKTDPRISQTTPPQQQESKPFDAKFSAFTAVQRDDAKTRSELRAGTGSTTDYFPQKQSNPLDINFNDRNSSPKETSRIRPEQGIGGAPDTDSIVKPLDSNFSKYSSIQRENSRIRTEQRLGIAPNSGLSPSQAFNPQKQQPPKQPEAKSDIPQRENSKSRTEQRLGITSNSGLSPNQEFKRQKQQPPKQLETNFNIPQRENSKTRTEQRLELGPNQDFNSQKQQPSKQFEGNFNSFRTRTEQRTNVGTPTFQSQKDIFPKLQLKQVHNNFDSNFNTQNVPQRDSSRTKAESRTDVPTRESFQQRDSFQQGEYNRVRPELTSTTGANTYSAAPPRGRGRINYKAATRHQGRSLENDVQSTTSGVKKFSTLVPKDQYYPTTFKPTTYKKAFDQKPTKNTEPKSRGTPFSTTPIPTSTLSESSSTPNEDDGQYHPELYENDFAQNNAAPTKRPTAQAPSKSQPHIDSQQQTPRTPQAHLQSQQQTSFQKQNQQPQQNFQQQQKHPLATPVDLSDEEELFKTAHSLNLGAASINKLRADTLKTTDKTHQSSLNFGFDKSTFATSISTSSLASTPSTTWRPTTSFSATTTTSTTVRPPVSSKKPKKSTASKRPPHADADTSYDYAYYDSLSETPQEYSEYDVISEFRKTKTH